MCTGRGCVNVIVRAMSMKVSYSHGTVVLFVLWVLWVQAQSVNEFLLRDSRTDWWHLRYWINAFEGQIVKGVECNCRSLHFMFRVG